MGEGDSVTETGEPGLGAGQGLGIAVDADDVQVGEAVEHRLGVTAEAQGRVNDNRPVPHHGGCEEVHDAVEEDRYVLCVAHAATSVAEQKRYGGSGMRGPFVRSLRSLMRTPGAQQ